MQKDGKSKLERFLNTVAGVRFLEEAERDAAVKEEAVADRRALAADLAEFHRRRREVKPGLDRVAEEAWEVANRAKAEYEALREKAADAGRAANSEFMSVNDGIRGTETRLLRSTDARIHAGIEEADEALRTWDERQNLLYRWRSEKASSWDGVTTWVKRWGNNQAGLDALKKGIEDAQKALERLALVAEPAEEAIAEGLAAVKSAVAAAHGDPPPLDMQAFDHNGQPTGKPVEMAVAK